MSLMLWIELYVVCGATIAWFSIPYLQHQPPIITVLQVVLTVLLWPLWVAIAFRAFVKRLIRA